MKRKTTPRPITCWAEVSQDGTFTCYDLAPTRGGIVGGGLSAGSRAVKVRVVPVERKK